MNISNVCYPLLVWSVGIKETAATGNGNLLSIVAIGPRANREYSPHVSFCNYWESTV
ncbi:hypothetical protein [Shouchella miscanthi]|uniref:Uncharacterized protein n=1 Tax=Shouchella miscanthi TaxID=2598861 RepID=A0ABU6NLL5_9BACI|nr:hypothetical protein [Shouchella miscanthi]